MSDTQTNSNQTSRLPPIGGGPVSPQEEEFGFTDSTGDAPMKSKYDFAFDQNKAYNARIVSAAQTVNSKGHKQLNLELLVLQGPAEGLRFKKGMAYTYTDKVTGEVKTNGFTRTTLKNAFGAATDPNTNELRYKNPLNKIVGVKFARGEYNGKMTTNVDDIVPPVEVPTVPAGGPIPF